MPFFDNEEKDVARRIAMNFNGVSRAAMLFPSRDMYCYEHGLSTRMFRPKTTTIYAIEKDEEVACDIGDILAADGFRSFEIHAAPAHELTCEKMQETLGKKKFDFAYIDMCNQLNRDTATWISAELGGLFCDYAVASFTFALQNRNYNNHYLAQQDVAMFGNLSIGEITHCCEHSDDFRKTVVGLHSTLCNHYSVRFERIHIYRSNRCPMILIRTKLRTHRAMRIQIQINEEFDRDMRRALRELEVPSGYSRHEQLQIFFEARSGIRPPWMKPQKWAWNPQNPRGMAHRRKQV